MRISLIEKKELDYSGYKKVNAMDDYGARYDVFNNPTFVEVASILNEGINPYTKRKITIGGKLYKNIFRELKENFGYFGYQDNFKDPDLGLSREEYIEKKKSCYYYVNRSTLENNKRIEERNDILKVENEKIDEQNKIISKYNEEMEKDCSLTITYEGKSYNIPCRYNCNKTPGCSSKHECEFVEKTKIVYDDSKECSTCRNWRGCGGYCRKEIELKYFECVKCHREISQRK